jgi:gas vesicle protein
MNENQGFSGNQLLLAFAGGAAIGAVVALLTAPQSGAKTREVIRERAHRTADNAARLPRALQGAVGAASDAFTEALARNVEVHG